MQLIRNSINGGTNLQKETMECDGDRILEDWESFSHEGDGFIDSLLISDAFR
jgi:hypothetical protein